MSTYTRYYTSRQFFYREFAARWLRWAETATLSETELKGIAAFFKQVARRFGLITEFRELGII